MQVLFELCVGVRDAMKGAIPEGDLTATEISIMRALSREQGLSLKQLGRRTGTHKSQMSRAAQSLQQRGLVERAVNPTDRRSFLLHTTPRVRDTLHEIVRTEDQLTERLLAGFSADERQQLAQLLHRLVTNLRSA